MFTVLGKMGLGVPKHRVRFWFVTLRLFCELPDAYLIVPGRCVEAGIPAGSISRQAETLRFFLFYIARPHLLVL